MHDSLRNSESQSRQSRSMVKTPEFVKGKHVWEVPKRTAERTDGEVASRQCTVRAALP